MKRILIVDDFSSIRAVIRHVVGELGNFDFDEAGDGASALQKLKQQSFDLVISDWNMPRMSGLDLLGEIRRDGELKALPVVMLTAESSRDNVESAIALGIQGYVTKPFRPDRLIAVVRPLL